MNVSFAHGGEAVSQKREQAHCKLQAKRAHNEPMLRGRAIARFVLSELQPPRLKCHREGGGVCLPTRDQLAEAVVPQADRLQRWL